MSLQPPPPPSPPSVECVALHSPPLRTAASLSFLQAAVKSRTFTLSVRPQQACCLFPWKGRENLGGQTVLPHSSLASHSQGPVHFPGSPAPDGWIAALHTRVFPIPSEVPGLLAREKKSCLLGFHSQSQPLLWHTHVYVYVQVHI